MKKTDDAIKFYEKSLEINPKSSATIREIISDFSKLKRYDEALMYCEYIKDDEFSYYLTKIHIYREMNEYSKALYCCTKFNLSNPNNYSLLSNKGRYLF